MCGPPHAGFLGPTAPQWASDVVEIYPTEEEQASEYHDALGPAHTLLARPPASIRGMASNQVWLPSPVLSTE